MVQSWLSEALPILNEAISHLNRASDLEGPGPFVERANAFFRALNKLWNVFGLRRDDGVSSDTALFRTLLVETISPEDQRELLDSSVVAQLATLDPAILNHDELNRARWQPGSEIAPPLRQKATEDHRRFRSGLERYREGAEGASRVLKKLASLLYVVRSNIAHGEKTPYGPDLEKRQRDETVCARVVPVQELVIRLILQHPERRLVAYGTLAPGGANHELVGRLRGEWQACTIRGRISERAGVPRFRWDPAAPEVSAKLLVSPDLPAAWRDLDRFEGQDYCRHLVPVRTPEADMVGFVYESGTA